MFRDDLCFARYVAIWTAFSLVAAFAQWFLHGRRCSPAMASRSAWLGGILL
jgi:predicted metal-binding membrane protein